jgi:hypothetical protein
LFLIHYGKRKFGKVINVETDDVVTIKVQGQKKEMEEEAEEAE